MRADSRAADYGVTRTVEIGFDEARSRIEGCLKEQGFGVLTTIDVQRTLKDKLGKDVDPYVILGACNPQLASRALEIEPDIGLLLPCNVIVASRGGTTRVGIVNPQSLVSFASNPALQDVADEADRRLRLALERV
jgi:uncharacterized protein (DUF302 family)